MACGLTAVLAGIAGATAASAAAPDVPPGSIIYSREVPLRAAHLPGEPGKPHYVDAGPEEVVLGSLGPGLSPLTDAEASAVLASPAPTAALAAPIGGTAMMAGERSASSLAVEHSGGGMVGGAIGSATSAIAGALSGATSALQGPR